jgi:geranylgeranyl pyrophosphate synthase
MIFRISSKTAKQAMKIINGSSRQVREKGVIERIQREAEAYVDKGTAFLDLFPESPEKKDLLSLGPYILTRRR